MNNSDRFDFSTSALSASAPPVDASTLEAVRAKALQALAREPVASSWKRQAATVAGVGLGVTAIGAVAAARFGGVAPEFATTRLPGILPLLGAQALALWAAIAPARRWNRQLAFTLGWTGLAGLGSALLIQSRARGVSPLNEDAAGWICSASHLALASAPAVVLLSRVRNISWSWSRALTGGAAVGLSGLVWGEIACERGLSHVLIHHFGTLAIMTAACALIMKRLSRESFAP